MLAPTVILYDCSECSFSFALPFLYGINSNDVDVDNLNPKKSNKLHLENRWKIGSRDLQTSPVRTEKLCSRRCVGELCVGGSQVAKLPLFLLEV